MVRNIKRKIFALITISVIFVLILWMCFSGGNYEIVKSVFDDELSNEEIHERLLGLGIRGYATVSILAMLQVVFTFLPAEPIQVVTGVAFGFPVGFFCCSIGVLLGNTAIFMLYKIFGNQMKEYFSSNLNINIEKAAKSKRFAAIILILYFLPAIPYGMICFLAASFGMKYPRFIMITLLGSIPSVCIGVGLGHLAIATSWIISLIVFAVLLVAIIVLSINRKVIFEKLNNYIDKPQYSSKTTVRKYKSSRLTIPYIISRIVFFLRGVKVKYINEVGEIESPSIVLCNHGSFIDFAYAGTLLRKKSPNFIVSRLYFYNKRLGNLLRSFGCFPKSMFALDIESAKNCVRVLREGGVLAMMPEARLSTVGKFEDIQPGTYAFLKKSAVTVYAIKIEGDYFASPKWGNGIRRGALVEAKLQLLITKEELAVLETDEIKKKVENRLYYNEFEWLKTKENVRYRSAKLAEGLENILTRCPKCKQKYTIFTKRRDVFCEKCGKLATINNRYLFDTDAPFENFADWYEWQTDLIRDQMSKNPDFSLSAEVELKMRSDDGKKMLQHAGRGEVIFDSSGLTYRGIKHGEHVEIHFPIQNIYRILFGAGEDFEIYVGQEIYYFVPDEKKSCVDFYIASMLIKNEESNAVSV